MTSYRELTIFTDGSGKVARIHLDGMQCDWPISVTTYKGWPSKDVTGQLLKVTIPRDKAPLWAAALNIAAIVLALSAIAMILLK